jgi:hypothetical protein
MELLLPSNVPNFLSKATTYAAAINDWVFASGNSWSLTLPSAVSQPGSVVTIQHNGTSLSQLYTLLTVGGQTIGGLASGGFVLWTNGEIAQLVSDGTNWQIGYRKTSIAFQADTPTIGATTTAPTLHAGAVFTGTGWSRDGIFMTRYFGLEQASAGSSGGSGIYLIPNPTGVLSTGIRVDTGAIGSLATPLGYAWTGNTLSAGTVTAVNGKVVAHSTSNLKIIMNSVASNDFQGWGSAFQQINATCYAGFIARFPVAGWQP